MALTQSAWSSKTVGTKTVATCTVVSTTAENDAYTLRTPKDIDVSKPYTLLYFASATPDGQALPPDIWIGYGADFALSGDGANVVATSGAKFKQMFDDVVLAVAPLVYTFKVQPDLAVADVVTVAAIATGPKGGSPGGDQPRVQPERREHSRSGHAYIRHRAVKPTGVRRKLRTPHI